MNEGKEQIQAIKQTARELISSLGELTSFISFTEELSPAMKRTLHEKVDKSLTKLAELLRMTDEQGYKRWKALNDLLSNSMEKWDE